MLRFDIGAHALRATAATNALDHQADIAKVQECDQGQSLRAHALPHSNARKACAIWRCKKTVIACGSDRVTAPAKIGASSIPRRPSNWSSAD